MLTSPYSLYPATRISGFRATAPGEKSVVAARHCSVPTLGETATMILDRLGRILSCGAPSERLFGARQHQLMGRRIAEFIAGLLLSGSSPGAGAKHLVRLCANGAWCRFEAKDVGGLRFAVDLNLSRIASSGRTIYLLSMRRLEETATP